LGGWESARGRRWPKEEDGKKGKGKGREGKGRRGGWERNSSATVIVKRAKTRDPEDTSRNQRRVWLARED